MLLFSGRADYVFTTKEATYYQAKKLGFDTSFIKHVKKEIMLKRSLSVAFGKKTDLATVKKYQMAFKDIVDNGTLKKIQVKWNVYNNEDSCS